jgi:hypothetical protein
MFARSVKAKRRKARTTCVNGRLLFSWICAAKRLINLPCVSWSTAGWYSWLAQLLDLEVSLDVIDCPFTSGYRKLSIYKREDQCWSSTEPAEGVTCVPVVLRMYDSAPLGMHLEELDSNHILTSELPRHAPDPPHPHPHLYSIRHL